MEHSNPEQISLSLLCVICKSEDRHTVKNILQKDGSLFSLFTFGKGTATSKLLSYLGLGETEKAVFFEIISTEKVDSAMNLLNAKLEFAKPGNGISFTMEIQQSTYHKPVKNRYETNGEKEMDYHLIFVISNQGYSEDVMDAAREAGAGGGTMLHARGVGAAGMEKFFGISIAPEKEILLIVSATETTSAIMANIARKAGIESDAHAVSFSLPVTAVNGMRAGKALSQ